jgi:Ca-activated chloride channel family protein
MSISQWLRSPRIRRGLAATALVLSAGGLVLFRADARALTTTHDALAPLGSTGVAFAGPGVHGTLSLSHSKVLAGGDQSVFAELKLVADPSSEAEARAPLSMAVVLDTSGSMSGDKIQQARDSVVQLVRRMRDDDEIAFVRYADDAQLVQPLSRVGNVRESLIDRIRSVEAGGGTAIPRGLGAGLDALSRAGGGRVRRVVLVSDGLDSTRAQAERLASDSFERGIEISSMGIGLDFDEAYMGAVARAGHGNFAFVQDASALASFLTRELTETATTTVENAAVHITLPSGVRFVGATGADARVDGSDVELEVGSLFAGDERRVLLELDARLDDGDVRRIEGNATWQRVGGTSAEAHIPRLDVIATNDARAVESGRDGNVLASATSVTASRRQLEAAQAYESGDRAKADSLIAQNLDELKAAQAYAPAPAASALGAQYRAYAKAKGGLASAPPMSTAAKAIPKQMAEKDLANVGHSAASF